MTGKAPPQKPIISVARFRRRLAVILVAAAAVAALPAVWFGWTALDDVRAEVDEGRLRLAQLAAAQADRIVIEAFFEIELMTQAVAVHTIGEPTEAQKADLRTAHGQASSFHSGVVLIDPDARVVLEVPDRRAGDVDLTEILENAAAADDRAVSRPWFEPNTGRVVAALSIPVFAADSTRVGTMVGVLDLTEPLVSDLIVPASRLGPTGHADLVDERGMVLVSTNPAHLLTTGDHPDFYRRVSTVRSPGVERVLHDPDPTSLDRSRWHIMAYAPLQNAPWGVAMGARESDTYETVSRLRHRLLVLGAASAITLFLGVVLALRLERERKDY